MIYNIEQVYAIYNNINILYKNADYLLKVSDRKPCLLKKIFWKKTNETLTSGNTRLKVQLSTFQ